MLLGGLEPLASVVKYSRQNRNEQSSWWLLSSCVSVFHAISLSMRAYSSLEQGFVFPYSSH